MGNAEGLTAERYAADGVRQPELLTSVSFLNPEIGMKECVFLLKAYALEPDSDRRLNCGQ